MSSILGNLFKALVPNPPGFVANTGGGAAPKTEAPAVEPPKAEVSGRPDAEALAKPEAPATAKKAITEDTVNAPVASTSSEKAHSNTVPATIMQELMADFTPKLVNPAEAKALSDSIEAVLAGKNPENPPMLKGTPVITQPGGKSQAETFSTRVIDTFVDAAVNHHHYKDTPPESLISSIHESLKPILDLAIGGNKDASSSLLGIFSHGASPAFTRAIKDVKQELLVQLAEKAPENLMRSLETQSHGFFGTHSLNILTKLDALRQDRLIAALKQKPDALIGLIAKATDNGSKPNNLIGGGYGELNHGTHQLLSKLLEIVKTATATDKAMQASATKALDSIVNHPQVINAISAKPATMPATQLAANDGNYALAA